MQLTEQSKSTPTSNPKSNTSSPRTPRSFTNSSSGPKKNFGGKNFRRRGKKGRGPVAKPVVKREPVFEYISRCCGVRAVKPALLKSSGDKKAPLGTLGGWRCGGCNKPTKVTRQKPVPPAPVEAVEVVSGS